MPVAVAGQGKLDKQAELASFLSVDPAEIAQDCLSKLEAVKDRFINSLLPNPGLIKIYGPNDSFGPICVAEAGGTNFRMVELSFQDGQLLLKNSQEADFAERSLAQVLPGCTFAPDIPMGGIWSYATYPVARFDQSGNLTARAISGDELRESGSFVKNPEVQDCRKLNAACEGDIAKYFLHCIADGSQPRSVVIANDTAALVHYPNIASLPEQLVRRVSEGEEILIIGGGVGSTGDNVAYIGPDGTIIVTELGMNYVPTQNFLPEFLQESFQGKELAIEEIVGGNPKFMPTRFKDFLRFLSDQHTAFPGSLKSFLAEGAQAHDSITLSEFAQGNFDKLQVYLDDASKEYLQETVQKFFGMVGNLIGTLMTMPAWLRSDITKTGRQCVIPIESTLSNDPFIKKALFAGFDQSLPNSVNVIPLLAKKENIGGQLVTPSTLGVAEAVNKIQASRGQ